MKIVKIDDELHAAVKKLINNRRTKLDYPTIQHYVAQAIKQKLLEDIQKLKDDENKYEYEFPLERIMIKKQLEKENDDDEDKTNI